MTIINALHVNILHEEQLYFPKQKWNEKSNIFNVWLNRGDTGWILASAVEFNLLPYDLLVKVYEQNLGSQKYAFGKERSILIFLDNYIFLQYYFKTQRVVVS